MKSLGIKVGNSKGKGRGVFATRNFKRGQVIETAPYVVVPEQDFAILQQTVLKFYVFGEKGNATALGLGFTSLYNHADEPNASYTLSAKRKTLTVRARRNIKAGEEILISYGYDLSVFNLEQYEKDRALVRSVESIAAAWDEMELA